MSWSKLDSSLVIVWLIIIVINNSIFVLLPSVLIRGAASGASAIFAEGNELFLGSNRTTLPPGFLDLFSVGDDYNTDKKTETKTKLHIEQETSKGHDLLEFKKK